QAEDGIRVFHVTGVQTCALPILPEYSLNFITLKHVILCLLKNFLSILFIVCCSLSLHAAHIVGGDFYYRCLGNNQYEITLKVYKDCFATGPNVADFDDPAFIGLFDQLNLLYNRYEVFLESRRNIPPV